MYNNCMNIIDRLKGKVVVSVQAMPSEPLYQEDCINAMMKSVVKAEPEHLELLV